MRMRSAGLSSSGAQPIGSVFRRRSPLYRRQNGFVLVATTGSLFMLMGCLTLDRQVPKNLRRVAGHDRVRRRIASDHTASAYNRMLADDDVREDRRPRANRGAGQIGRASCREECRWRWRAYE